MNNNDNSNNNNWYNIKINKYNNYYIDTLDNAPWP
jgi:hypothetical protein